MENIFSLLFLSDSDFSPQSDQISTATETQPDTNTENTKPNSAISMSKAESILSAEKEGGKLEELREEIQSRDFDQMNPELGHLTSGCRGFLVDLSVMEGILRLVKEGLEGVCGVGQEDGRALAADVSWGRESRMFCYSGNIQRPVTEIV